MKSICAWWFLAAAMMLAGPAKADAQTNSASPSVFAPIEFLVGGVWSADLPAPASTNQVKFGIEARYEWTGNHQGIRFESNWVTGDKRRPYCSGIYLWNPEKQEIEISYADAKGSLVQGAVKLDGDVRLHDMTLIDKTGKTQRLQARMSHPDPNHYVNSVSMMQGDTWQQLISVRYERP